jgi:uncharacterized protein
MSSAESGTRQIEIGGYPFTVELAQTPEERAKGLSGRKYLPSGTGMLFTMDGKPANFHMKNTHVPLDIVYLDASGVILKIDGMQPHVGRSHCDDNVSHVIELPASTCDELAVEVGDRIEVENVQSLRNLVSEALVQEWENPKRIRDIVYRPWSTKFYKQVRQIKARVQESNEKLTAFEKEMMSTDIGEFGVYEGRMMPLDIPIPAELVEAEYKGREVELNSPSRSSGPKKYKVYVKNEKGNVVQVNFGDAKGGLSAKIEDPEANASFVARHNCKSKAKEDKTKPGYWSCRLPRYWDELGLKKTSKKWW